jgi:UDP-N-acetyl-2-amino-2-deoxyglucuronate dehydrogenase
LTSKDKIRFAIAGYGHIGTKLAAVIDAGAETELVGVCDVKPHKGLHVPFYDSLANLLTSGADIDVLCVATPNGLHAEHTLMGLRSGHHVLVEKPMALTKEDCSNMIAAAQEYGRQLFCVMQNRYAVASQWLKGLVDKNVLGKIFIVQVNCYWNRDERYYKTGNWHGTKQLDGGVLFTQFSHFIDMMHWLFGDVQNIHARIANFRHGHLTEFEDSGLASFEFVNGGMGCMNFSTAVWNKNLESSITIIAEHGTVKVSGQYMERVELCNIKNYEMPAEMQLLLANGPTAGGNHEYVFQNVVDVLKGRAPMHNTPAEGMKVVDIIERIHAAAVEALNEARTL